MAVFTKPDFNSVWASSGIKIKPESSKMNQGWIVEIPAYEHDNWLRNRQDAMLAHLNQMGLPVWDNITEYQGGKSYVQGASTGVVYKALTTNTSINPETDVNNNWVVAFQASGEALLKNQNLADVPNKAQARTNLGILTTADYDARYLQKSNNLSDVLNKATARANLEVYGRTETYTRDEIYALSGVGMVNYFAGLTAPSGWLPADGRAISRSQYSALFDQIGTLYGAGNGTTTFNLPDLRGEFLRGWDNGRGVDVGRAQNSWQGESFTAHRHGGTTNAQGNHQHWMDFSSQAAGDHNHWVNDPGHQHNTILPAKQNYQGGGPVAMVDGKMGVQWEVGFMSSAAATGIWLSNAGNHAHRIAGLTDYNGTHAHNLNIDSSGGNETRPRNIAMLACIKV